MNHYITPYYTQKMNEILVSIIVPAFNVENYLAKCLNSLLTQTLQEIEIIVINDCSTDATLQIAMDYASKNNRIRIYQQPVHRGVSAARNIGLSMATGHYIGFVDSDDWVSPHAFQQLYQQAISFDADIVMGTIIYCYEDGRTYKPENSGTLFASEKVINGQTCFSYLIKTGYYVPMICSNLYKNKFIQDHQLNFEGMFHEDEYFTPLALFYASRVTNITEDFYFYRQRPNSIMHSNNLAERATSLVHITNQFFNFVHRNLNRENQESCFWITFQAFRLYIHALNLYEKSEELVDIPTSASELLHSFINKLTSDQWNQLYAKYTLALEKRTLLMPGLIAGKTLILFYNTMWNEPLNIPTEQIPDDCILTTNKYYLPKANAVIFHLPNLMDKMKKDIEKPDGQLWVAWSLECDQNHVWVDDPALEGVFDIRMGYHQEDEIVFPYYYAHYQDLFYHSSTIPSKINKACMFVSSPINKSKRIEYLKELMQHTEIDSYGKLFNNKKLENDKGNNSKIEIFSQYKFIIAFENALAPDYVTEKFFDPLIAGSVPVYLGAPNITDFAPGNNCFIDVTKFKNPQALANFMNACYLDESLYEQYLRWKEKPLRSEFSKKAEIQQIHPFVRLYQLIKKKNN